MNWRAYRSQQNPSRNPRSTLESSKSNGKGFILPWYGVLALILGIVGLLIYAFLLSPWFKLEQVDLEGSQETLPEQAQLTAYFQQYLGKNLISFDSSFHEEKLLEMFPYLETVSIEKDFPDRLIVNIETSPNVANVTIQKNDGTEVLLLINSQGYVTNVGVSDESLPKIIMDVTGTDLVLSENTEFMIKQELIPKERLDLLLEAKESFEAKFDMQVLWLVYLKRAREVHLYTERDFYVWIDLMESIETQLDKLKYAATKLNIYEANLDYIDLRIFGENGEKVIYKLK